MLATHSDPVGDRNSHVSEGFQCGLWDRDAQSPAWETHHALHLTILQKPQDFLVAES